MSYILSFNPFKIQMFELMCSNPPKLSLSANNAIQKEIVEFSCNICAGERPGLESGGLAVRGEGKSSDWWVVLLAES